MANGQLPSERDQRIAAAGRRRLLRSALWIGIAVLVVAGGGYGLIRYSREQSVHLPGVAIPDQGRQHAALGTPFEYNSNPPTSGPHFDNPEEWGIFRKEIPDQIMVHNLEHGGVWISYRPGIATSTIERLEALGREFGRKVIMAPRQANDSDIALAAWTRLDKFSESEFSEERVRDFVRAWRNKGPEFVP
ncbi:MAG: DUF3105 domain-containing protein [Candidatus Sungbacteria bacterium]|uniref:DUF3105 domain-containing protein n=1 Tax=Candidatus Sungiibacteriota bacterium TaxID=2750080 RepID=A0A932YWH5_9BACT|nr:DUF3105 domain-containing protein [Candidatus Sungbacteria bacterium]